MNIIITLVFVVILEHQISVECEAKMLVGEKHLEIMLDVILAHNHDEEFVIVNKIPFVEHETITHGVVYLHNEHYVNQDVNCIIFFELYFLGDNK